ncbi:MAG: hypothetical protein JSU63_18010, partial [Phycisphaerales bacterium]
LLDLDFDDDVDDDDLDLFDDLPQGLARHPGRIASGVDQPFGHKGLLFEPEIGSYQNRARQYLQDLGRFAQRDPIGLWDGPAGDPHLGGARQYRDGMTLYSYLRGSPLRNSDPMGLGTCNDLFLPGGSCETPVGGCLVCDGSGGYLACVNDDDPDECGGSSDDPVMGCRCMHELKHFEDWEAECPGACNVGGTPTPFGKFPSTNACPSTAGSKPCIQARRECDAFHAEFGCLAVWKSAHCTDSPAHPDCFDASLQQYNILAYNIPYWCHLEGSLCCQSP